MSENNIVHTTETPTPEYVEERIPYCTGCEQAEIQECKAEIMYEDLTNPPTYAQVMRHVHSFFRPIVCQYCEDEAAEYRSEDDFDFAERYEDDEF